MSHGSCDRPQDLSVTQARERILSRIEPVPERQRVATHQALGRILGEALVARHDLPPFSSSAMDGYALRSADASAPGVVLRSVGRALAGHPYTGRVDPLQCVRIMTGAPVPPDCDAVIPQENVEICEGSVRLSFAVTAGDNVRPAGEDFRASEEMLPSGHRLRAIDLGLVASMGLDQLVVTRPITVAYFSTGDELQMLGKTLGPGQIFDSNRPLLAGLFADSGIELQDLGVIPDDREATRSALTAAASADVVVTTGGVSVGEADYVKDCLAELGQVDIWRVALKPGRPLTFGRLDRAWFFGLPGNPVSAVVTYLLFVRPALQRLAGCPIEDPQAWPAIADEPLRKRPGREEYQRGYCFQDPDGQLRVRSTGSQGSGLIGSLTRGNCFIHLAAESGSVTSGDVVSVIPYAACF
ncbi:MAG: molybdopterin molybdotransferase MoeA [Pseudomonadota bacterium]|nr:molybdopterin molybdotransferase MoeA [Pseudomonadota bacterium]